MIQACRLGNIKESILPCVAYVTITADRLVDNKKGEVVIQAGA